MAKISAIEWTDATWNPWIGCNKVSPGCKNCYMFRDRARFGHDPTEIRMTAKKTFTSPLRWKEGRIVFVCSWSDFFHPRVNPAWRQMALELMADCPHHIFLVLTKRPEYISQMVPFDWFERNPHVWLGFSAENAEMLNLRAPLVCGVPAAGHFVSIEPMLGAMPKLYEWLPFLQWCITGGESDLSNPRPSNPDWFRSVRDQCYEYGVPLHHKQNGGRKKIDGAWGGRLLDGQILDAFPPELLALREARDGA